MKKPARRKAYPEKNPLSVYEWLQTALAVVSLGGVAYVAYGYFKFGGDAKYGPTQFSLETKPSAAVTPSSGLYALLEDVASGDGIVVLVTGTGTLDTLPSCTGTVQQVVAMSNSSQLATALATGDKVAFHNVDVLRTGTTVAGLVTQLQAGIAALLTGTPTTPLPTVPPTTPTSAPVALPAPPAPAVSVGPAPSTVAGDATLPPGI